MSTGVSLLLSRGLLRLFCGVKKTVESSISGGVCNAGATECDGSSGVDERLADVATPSNELTDNWSGV